MALQTMYPGMVNSPQTELASAIDNQQTTIPLLDASKLPPAPNLATIGVGEDAETILYTGVSGNDLTGVTRGFQGAAKAWVQGTKVARNFTAYDYDALRQNVADHTAATTGVHGATSAATPNTIVQRDGNGRFKAAAPAASDDVARKDTVDNAIAALRGAAPGTLDTLAKLAQAIANDPNFAATINAALAGKLSTSGGTMTGQLTVDYPNNGGFARIGIRNTAQTLDLAAYWEAGVTQFAQVQSWDIVSNAPRLLRLNPLGGTVLINDFEAWHSGNNPANLAGNGYQKLASGFILQWGVVANVPPSTATSITFPIAFPNAVFSVHATVDSNTPASATAYDTTNSGVKVVHNESNNRAVYYLAIGW